MAGIYIHIPFCKQACYYCDFHFSTVKKNIPLFIKALKKEIVLKKDYLGNESINTIYFGGGTPSILKTKDIHSLLETVYQNYSIVSDPEITLEANPDNLNRKIITEIKHLSVNRISIGVQSFFDSDLVFMNRGHSAKEAVYAVKRCQDTGFKNISIDLIYATETLTDKNWEKNIDIACDLSVQHISAYCLTIEQNTAFAVFIKKNKIKKIDEHKAAIQYEMLVKKLTNKHFIHYEISNFAKNGYISQHNSSYWKQQKYIGFGPSSHSYNGQQRQWNISNNPQYIKALLSNNPFFETEQLTQKAKYNEYVMTALRTMWGIDLHCLSMQFGEEYLQHLITEVKPYVAKRWLSLNENTLLLTQKGKLFADKVTSDLFLV